MFTLRQGLFKVEGELKSFDPMPEGIRFYFPEGQIVELARVNPVLLQALKSVGLVKLKDSTVDVVMGKIFLNAERRQQLADERKRNAAEEDTAIEEVVADADAEVEENPLTDPVVDG